MRLPPQATELEEVVLGACLIDTSFYLISDKIKPEHFYLPQHQIIYKAMQSLFDKGSAIDMLTVVTELKLQGRLDDVGMWYISQLTNKIASSAHIESHALIIKQKFIQRELIRLGMNAVKEAYNDTTDALELLNNYTSNLLTLSNEGSLKKIETNEEMVDKLAKKIAELKQKKGDVIGIPTGLNELDKGTCGLLAGLHIIAGRPGMGKSAFVLTIVKNICLQKIPCLFFTIEMDNISQSERLLSSLSGVEYQRIKDPRYLSKDEDIAINNALLTMQKMPLYWDDSSSIDTTEIRAKIIRQIKDNGIKVVVVDYLQLMNGKGQNREQEVAHITRTLKAISKEHNIPVLALAQLSRSVEQRGGSKRPTLSDLRESGSVEQDADTVMFIYRPEYYGIETDDKGDSTKGVAEIIIAKQRSGFTGTIYLNCDLKYMRFDNKKESYSPTFEQKKAEVMQNKILPKGKEEDFNDDF